MSGNERPPRRRDILRASAGASLVGITGLTATSATAQETTTTQTETQEVDSPEGYNVEVVAPYATFTNDVAIEFQITDADDAEDTTPTPEGTATPVGASGAVSVDDASTVVVAEATWEPEGNTGWHTHPGPVIINVTEGELEIVDEDCTTTTYTAGDAFIDTGQHAHLGRNPSDTEQTVIYATFLGVPDGEPATNWVEPRDC